MEEKISKLKDLIKIQSSKGNFDVNDYMRGLANGLICALSVFTDEEPKYIEQLAQQGESIKDIQFYKKDGRVRLQKLMGNKWFDVLTFDDTVEKNGMGDILGNAE